MQFLGVGVARARSDEFAAYWVLNFGTLIVFWVIFSYLDFLGLEGALKEQSRQIMDRVVAPFYARDPYRAVGNNNIETLVRAQDKIAVVLITDDTAKELGTYHPLPFSYHELNLSRIMEQNPAAVFIDIQFLFERHGDKFEELLESFKARLNGGSDGENFHVFFAGGSLADLADMPEVLKPYGTIVAWEDEAHQYPLLIPRGGLAPDEPTAAMALFGRLCLVKPALQWSGCPAGIEASVGAAPLARIYGDSLALRWGATAPRRQQMLWSTAKCPLQADASDWQRVKAAWNSILSKLFAGLADDIDASIGDRNPCFYHLTIPPERLKEPRVLTVLRSEQSDTVPNSPPLLKDRVVFYGSRVSGVHDFVTSATHGLVPGVFAHAMAFDNLLTYGPDYIKGDEAGNDAGIVKMIANYEFGLWCLISAALAVGPSRGRRLMALDMAHGLVAFVRRSGGTIKLLIRMLIWPGPIVSLARWLTRRMPLGRSCAPPAQPRVIVWHTVHRPRRMLLQARERQTQAEPDDRGPAAVAADGIVARFQQGDMMLFAVILLVSFLANEFFWRREVADWLGLTLLYFLVTHVGHVTEN